MKKIKGKKRELKKIGLLNFEGDVFVVVRKNNLFDIIDYRGEKVVMLSSPEYILGIYDGKETIKTSEGRLYDISKEHPDAKPERKDLIDFLGLDEDELRRVAGRNFSLSFELSDKQQKEFDEWKAALKKIYGEYGSFEWTIIPTGIGDGLVVYSKLANAKLDLTDMDSW